LGRAGFSRIEGGLDNQRPLGFMPHFWLEVKTLPEKFVGTQRRWCTRTSFVVSTLRAVLPYGASTWTPDFGRRVRTDAKWV